LGKTEIAETKGTLLYLAPEILDGQADERSDIFALGVTLYQLLSGSLFYGETKSIGNLLTGQLPERKSIMTQTILQTLQNKRKFSTNQLLALQSFEAPEIKKLIGKMTAFSPGNRYQSCAEIIADINAKFDKMYPLETEQTRDAYVLGASFVGRASELNRLIDWLNAREAAKKLFLVHGEAGIGKSRLFEEFKKYCQLRNIGFLQGDGSEFGQAIFGIFLPILRELFLQAPPAMIKKYGGELKKLLPDHERLKEIRANPTQPPKIERGLLIQNITNFLIDYAQNRPSTGSGIGKIVLYLNDMHWADKASIEALEELMYKINSLEEEWEERLCVYASSRPEGLVKLKNIQDKDRLIDVELRSFDKQNVQSYIDAVFGNGKIDVSLKTAIPHINKKVGGNPFFLQELVKSLVERGLIDRQRQNWALLQSMEKIQIPTNLKAIIRSRIERLNLSDAHRRIIQILSLLNYSPTFEELNQIVSTSYGFLSKLERLEIVKSKIVEDQAVYRAAHDLIRVVIREQIPNPADLHLHVAQKLEEIHSDNLNEYIQELADHYSETDQKEKALLYLEKAGDQAKANYQNQRAIEFYDRLLAFLNEDQIEKHVHIFLKKGEILSVIGEWDENKNILSQALDLAKETENENIIARANLFLGTHYWAKGDFEQAESLFDNALKISQKLNDKSQICIIFGKFGQIYDAKGNYDDALKYYERQLKISRELDRQPLIVEALSNMGGVYHRKGSYEAAMEYYRQQLNISQEIKYKFGIATAIGNMGSIYLAKGDCDNALACFGKLLKISEDIGDKMNISVAIANMGVIDEEKGDYTAALNSYERLLDVSREADNKRILTIALYNIGGIYRKVGRYDDAIKFYDQAIEIASNLGLNFHLCSYLLDKAEVLFDLDMPEDAWELAEKSLRLAEQTDNKEQGVNAKIFQAKMECRFGNWETGINMLRDLLKQAENERQTADIHYELFQFSVNAAEHRQKALALYQKLYEKTSRIQYKERINELEKDSKSGEKETFEEKQDFDDLEKSFL
jgi:tetratricopeptide (TPR) repeat protein